MDLGILLASQHYTIRHGDFDPRPAVLCCFPVMPMGINHMHIRCSTWVHSCSMILPISIVQAHRWWQELTISAVQARPGISPCKDSFPLPAAEWKLQSGSHAQAFVNSGDSKAGQDSAARSSRRNVLLFSLAELNWVFHLFFFAGVCLL